MHTIETSAAISPYSIEVTPVSLLMKRAKTVQMLNDRGYSYLLRGDLGKARAKFLKAYQLDPTNPTVINNLQLLNSSYRFVERAP